MTQFGAGQALDENLDFKLDSTGDIDHTNGVKELEKDLAFQNKIALEDVVGAVSVEGEVTPTIIDKVRERLLLDPRILRITSIDVSNTRVNQQEQYTVNADVVTREGERDLVFEV